MKASSAFSCRNSPGQPLEAVTTSNDTRSPCSIKKLCHIIFIYRKKTDFKASAAYRADQRLVCYKNEYTLPVFQLFLAGCWPRLGSSDSHYQSKQRGAQYWNREINSLRSSVSDNLMLAWSQSRQKKICAGMEWLIKSDVQEKVCQDICTGPLSSTLRA